MFLCVCVSPLIFSLNFSQTPILTLSSIPPSSNSLHTAFSQRLMKFLVLILALLGYSRMTARPNFFISLDRLYGGKCKKPLGNCILLWLLFLVEKFRWIKLISFFNLNLQSCWMRLMAETILLFGRVFIFLQKQNKKNNKFSHCQAILKSQNIIF